jgi:hypothetical protein
MPTYYGSIKNAAGVTTQLSEIVITPLPDVVTPISNVTEEPVATTGVDGKWCRTKTVIVTWTQPQQTQTITNYVAVVAPAKTNWWAIGLTILGVVGVAVTLVIVVGSGGLALPVVGVVAGLGATTAAGTVTLATGLAISGAVGGAGLGAWVTTPDPGYINGAVIPPVITATVNVGAPTSVAGTPTYSAPHLCP